MKKRKSEISLKIKPPTLERLRDFRLRHCRAKQSWDSMINILLDYWLDMERLAREAEDAD